VACCVPYGAGADLVAVPSGNVFPEVRVNRLL
jgi:hypothetical protein